MHTGIFIFEGEAHKAHRETMLMQKMQQKALAGKALPAQGAAPRLSRRAVVRCNAAAAPADDLGFKKMREGVKEASAESLLTPRL